jgi:hypothetical protein
MVRDQEVGGSNPLARPLKTRKTRCARLQAQATRTILSGLWLANCYFSRDSSGFSVLLRFFDAQSCRSFHPFHRRPGSVARSWRGPFPRGGVASPQAPDPDLESLPETISPSTRIGSDPRWLAGTLAASHSTAPFRNRSEAFDTAI